MEKKADPPVFLASQISKSFFHGKKKVLENISFDAHGGECIGILGANGCGKSTLLSILAGILKADSGSLFLNGTELLHKKRSQKTSPAIGYVPQEYPLLEELSALDNLKLWYADSPLSLDKELSSSFLAMLGIPDFLKVRVRQMSGGMKKRLSIGCAAAKDPRVLILDEPGAALDLVCKERIAFYLKNYKDSGNMIIIATHEEQEINFCDRLYLLKDGSLSPYCFDGNIHHLAKVLGGWSTAASAPE